MNEQKCAWCGEPATHRASHQDVRLPACALHAAVAARKHTWMPCVINADFDGMTPEQQARVLRETKWADNIANAEWPVVLREDGASKHAKARLKKKAVGWLMALSRIIVLNPALAVQVLREADAQYREQLREPPLLSWAVLADLIEFGSVQSATKEAA